MSPSVSTLRNVGTKVAAALEAAGLGTVDALRRAGSVEAFRRMQAAAPALLPVRHYLYAIEAGLMGIAVADLPMRRRIELFRAARGWASTLPANEARPKHTIRARRGRRRR